MKPSSSSRSLGLVALAFVVVAEITACGSGTGSKHVIPEDLDAQADAYGLLDGAFGPHGGRGGRDAGETDASAGGALIDAGAGGTIDSGSGGRDAGHRLDAALDRHVI